MKMINLVCFLRQHNPFEYLKIMLQLWIILSLLIPNILADGCPPSEAILPCRCSTIQKTVQIWCSHSSLPQIIEGLKSVERNIKGQIDELILENNQLPALPGRFFGTMQIVRLMLRYNSIERVSNGWLNELENSLVEIYIVEPQLRSIPSESLNGMINLIAITIESDELKHLPNFSGLLSLTYLSVQTKSLIDLQSHNFRHLPKLQNIHINGGEHLIRSEAGVFDGLISLKNIDLSRNGINWIHLRSFRHLPNLVSIKLSYNQIGDANMIGRIIKDLENLKKLRLDHNTINIIEDGSFVDLPHLSELHLNDNRITEIQYGAFYKTPMLKIIYLHNNHIKRIHPESFLQASGSGIETMHIYNNRIEDISQMRSLLNSLPTLKFLDISNNQLTDIPFGALRGHGTLEQLHLNNNNIQSIERDAFIAMPSLRELRLHNNSLHNDLPMPFWNLPGLKGLDLSMNKFKIVDSHLLVGLPSLRRLDLSENGLQELDPATFMHNPMLETLNISGNELTTWNSATLRNLDRLFEVDASNNRLQDILPGLPNIVERISLRANLISSLQLSSRKYLNLPNLRMLDLSSNHLEFLPKHIFQNVPQLRVLSLANNRLRVLDDMSFIGGRQIELLHLQDNELMHIDDRSFLPMSELRNLNLQGNKITDITDSMFWNSTQLELLNLSHNKINSISPSAFESQKLLEYLDLSGNDLADISMSLATLSDLRDIDLSYNKLTHIPSDIIKAWHNIIEIRMANNRIEDLKHGTFRNLPKLQYLDLSSNELRSVEKGSLKNLTDLQEFVLADNRLFELKDQVFEDLPNLLAVHFQYNLLQYISPECFRNAPSMLFLNLSNNHFRNMDNIGLRSMRNLEVLDLSMNNVHVVTTMPLKHLKWLVELKMDNNRICKIKGSPFESMPRLRVLSIKNNRLSTIKERTFRNLKGNIAILDVAGNPIVCSCEMQWLSIWLQETNSQYPGPKCQDGRFLRDARMEKSLCSDYNDNNARTPNGNDMGSTSGDDSVASGLIGGNTNNLPLINEHGDIFQRELHDDVRDDCEKYEFGNGDRPLAGESEYFYDQYVDYIPSTETNGLGIGQNNQYNNYNENTTNNGKLKPPTVSTIDMNNTILNAKYFTKPPIQPSTSPFTFFGYPIPILSIGRFFSTPPSRDRMEKYSNIALDKMPGTHRIQNHSRGKVRMYEPSSSEFERYLNKMETSTQYHAVTPRSGMVDSESNELSSSEEPQIIFKTSFKEPERVERGGFRPIVMGQVGGFIPIHDPKRAIIKTVSTSAKDKDSIELKHKRNSFEWLEDTNLNTETTTMKNDKESTMKSNFVTEAPIDNTSAINYLNKSIKVLTTTSRPTKPTTPRTDILPKIHTNTEIGSDKDLNDDLDTFQTTTLETILLIPPHKEQDEEKPDSRIISTLSTIIDDDLPYVTTAIVNISTTTPLPPSISTVQTTNSQSPHISGKMKFRIPGGRSRIVKVNTPQTFHHFLPTAEEYYRTTPKNDLIIEDIDANPSSNIYNRNDESITDLQVDRSDRKGGMDWYYESFFKRNYSYETKNKMSLNETIAIESRDLLRHSGGLKIISNNWYITLIPYIYIFNCVCRYFFYIRSI